MEGRKFRNSFEYEGKVFQLGERVYLSDYGDRLFEIVAVFPKGAAEHVQEIVDGQKSELILYRSAFLLCKIPTLDEIEYGRI